MPDIKQSIKTGLEQAIDFGKGNTDGHTIHRPRPYKLMSLDCRMIKEGLHTSAITLGDEIVFSHEGKIYVHGAEDGEVALYYETVIVTV